MRALDKRLSALEGNAAGSFWVDVLETLTDAQLDRLEKVIPSALASIETLPTEDLHLLAALRLPLFVPDVAKLAQSLLVERADA